MTARTQQQRTATNNSPPGVLLPGQLYVEMGTPFRLWGGVPANIDATGRKLLVDATNVGPWVPSSGGAMTGLLTLSGAPVNPGHAATKAYTDGQVASAFNGVGRNLIHNPLFNVAQRGNGSFATNGGYTADRWQLGVTLDTVNVQRVAISDANRAAIGDEEAKFLLTNTFTGNAGATANNFIQQPIEDAYRLAGKTVTVSFWANASAPAIGVNILQHFGTGGSPSASVYALSTGIKIALTATWTRYSATITVPSVAGKTFGTNNDSRTTLMFFCSSGSNNNAFAGNIGVQGPSATINLWGVQLEIGNVATPLEKPDPRYDLSNCQRFFQYTSPGARGSGTTTISLASFPSWPQMRGVPTATLVNNGTRSNVGASSLTVFNTFSGFFTVATSGAGDGYVLNETYALSADL